VIYGKLTFHDRQTDEVHVEITRKGLTHARPNESCPQTADQPRPMRSRVYNRAAKVSKRMLID